MTDNAALSFTLYSRKGCHLCDDMETALRHYCEGHNVSINVVDVDSQPALAQRYGLKVPVLVEDDEIICYGRLDEELLADYLLGEA